MQISLTKKLADAIGIKPNTADESINPLFCWTANWTNTFDRKKEDMLVLVNHATRFTVTIYGVKRNQIKNAQSLMVPAIKSTLLSMTLNPEMVEEYLKHAGVITYASNHNRKLTAQVNQQGLKAAFHVGRAVIESRGSIKFDDSMGRIVSRDTVDYGNNYPHDGFVPTKEMTQALSEITGKPAYRYQAFELLVTLDLEIYKATRRLIVPADIEFTGLHKVLQRVFDWDDYHLYVFTVFNEKTGDVEACLVPDEESVLHDDRAVQMAGHKLSEYFPKKKRLLYTYDIGDNWQHAIELVRTIDDYTEESPYLLEASGQTPPEDVGGVSGFLDFREIMLDPDNSEYEETKEWAGYWSPELPEWKSRPGVIYY